MLGFGIVLTALLAMACSVAHGQVTLSHLESPGITTTTASATISDLTSHPPVVVFADALFTANGLFSGSGGATGSFVINYAGYKIIDEATFALTNAHELNLAGSSYPNSWGIEGDPSGRAVGESSGENEAIVISFDLSGLTLAPGQSLVLKGVQATGNFPQHSAVVRDNGDGTTTVFSSDAAGLTTLDEALTDGAAFAYIHAGNEGGSRLDTITIDIVGGPPPVEVMADPPQVVGTFRDVTIRWAYPGAPPTATVAITADQPATIGAVTGNAEAGSVLATVADGANGDIRFSVTVEDGGVEVAGGSVMVLGYERPSLGPNILFVTVDDMSADSVGIFGCPVPFTTPSIDTLASTGIRFNHAHVVCGSCKPSRNAMMSGLYPHTNGVEGFRTYPDTVHPLLPDLLKHRGYFVGIYHKVSHTTPAAYDWDLSLGGSDLPVKDSQSYYTATKQGIAAALDAGKPFYLNINISDPHLPYYGIQNKSTTLWADPNIPSRLYTTSEIVVPGFLPDSGDVPLEVAHYYMSVRRADDCLAKALEALDEFGLREHTLIVFLSDHGMPQPFAKACIYHHSSRTPLIASWPGVITANTVDNDHMVSAVDLMPTLLDAAGSPHPYGLEGKSFYGALLGQSLPGFDHVIKEVDETSNRQRLPMRSVQTHRYGYVFNTWSDGTRDVRNATENTLADKRMEELAAGGDPYWMARDNHFEFRAKEEFYDYVIDPDALNNLIDSSNPAVQEEIARHRELLRAWMVRTYDHALVAFEQLADDAAIEAYWQSQSSDPPVIPELTKLERLMDRLQFDVIPPAFRFAIDPRLTNTTWEFQMSPDLSTWDSFQLTDPSVTYDPITGEVEVRADPGEATWFFRLLGSVP